MLSAHVHSRYPNIPHSSTIFSTKKKEKKRNPNTEYMTLDIAKRPKQTFSTCGVKFYHLTTPFHFQNPISLPFLNKKKRGTIQSKMRAPVFCWS